MTSGGPTTQHGQAPGGYPPPGPIPPPSGPGVPPPGWNGGQWQPPTRPSRRRGVLIGAGITTAIILSAAALVVAIVRQPAESALATSNSTSTSAAPAGDTSAADKALCQKIGPLLREGIDLGKNFVALGHSGSPERDAGIPAYRTAIDDWASRIQPILDANADPSRYLTRTLQQFVDLRRLYAENIRPGPALDTDTEAWDESLIAYGGPWETCHALGVTW